MRYETAPEVLFYSFREAKGLYIKQGIVNDTQNWGGLLNSTHCNKDRFLLAFQTNWDENKIKKTGIANVQCDDYDVTIDRTTTPVKKQLHHTGRSSNSVYSRVQLYFERNVM